MKEGDKVRIKSEIKHPQNGCYYVPQNISVGEEFTLKEWLTTKENGRYWLFEEKNEMGLCSQWAFEFQLELLSNSDNIAQNKMNIQEKFVLAFKSEPEKTFRKTGITNGDDILTDDGQKIFLSWLLKKNQVEFKKEVADEILKDLEDEKK